MRAFMKIKNIIIINLIYRGIIAGGCCKMENSCINLENFNKSKCMNDEESYQNSVCLLFFDRSFLVNNTEGYDFNECQTNEWLKNGKNRLNSDASNQQDKFAFILSRIIVQKEKTKFFNDEAKAILENLEKFLENNNDNSLGLNPQQVKPPGEQIYRTFL